MWGVNIINRKAVLPSLDLLISLPFAALAMASLLFCLLFVSNGAYNFATSQSRAAEMFLTSQKIVYAIESGGMDKLQSISLLHNFSMSNISFALEPLGSCNASLCRIVTINGNSYSLVVK